MGDTTESSSSEGERLPRRRSSRLSADRGTIQRQHWASSSSDTETEVEAERVQDDDDDSDASDEISLAQREQLSSSADSGEETEDEEVAIKREFGIESDTSDVRIKTEPDQGSDDDDDDDDDSTEDEDGDGSVVDEGEHRVSIKSESADVSTSSDNEATQRSGSESVKSESEQDEDEPSSARSSSSHARRSRQRGRHNGMLRSAGDDLADAEEDDEAQDPIREAVDAQAAVDQEGEHAEEEKEEDEDEEVDAEGDDEIDETDDNQNEIEDGGVNDRTVLREARHTIDQIAKTYLTVGERTALYAGQHLSGPPIDRPISLVDQWKRKYRWPVAMRNVRRRKFIADPEELALLHDVPLSHDNSRVSNVSATATNAFAAALAPTVRPVMEAAMSTYREQKQERQCRNMKFVEQLEETKQESGDDVETVDTARLRTLTRIGEHFTDQLLDSILVKNVLALQGIDASYAQQCWDPLPTSKRPVANWRFVLEHFCRTSSHGVDASAVALAPRLRKDTLMRIRDRLRTLYGVAWRSEDEEFFDLVDGQEIDPPEPEDIIQL